MEGADRDSADADDSFLQQFPSILSDSEQQTNLLLAEEMEMSSQFEPDEAQEGPRNRTVTPRGVSPLALLRAPVANYASQTVLGGNLQHFDADAAISGLSGAQKETVPPQQRRTRVARLRKSETINVYGLKNEVTEHLFSVETPQAPSHRVSKRQLEEAAGGDLDMLEIAACTFKRYQNYRSELHLTRFNLQNLV